MNERVAFVSGAGQGIGRASAEALGAAGRAVAVADINEETGNETVEAIAAAGGRALFVPVDVTDGDAVATAVERATAELGPIDILVNNVGWDELKPFLDTDEEFWRKIVELNYFGNLRLTKAVAPGMVERGWGRIVSIASDAARVGSSYEGVYSGAKGGVVSFSKTLARELARTGVTVNCVCPGPTKTPPLVNALAAAGDAAAEFEKKFTRAIPMKRFAEPREIAHAVAFLASDGAGYITGQTLSVSGGLTMA
jgi:2-hydroxycyclohexanecarboxyl-CoA dehydrogenase